MQMLEEKYSAAIYIVGPDHKKQYKQNLKFLETKFDKVIVIGDGEHEIYDDNDGGPLLSLKTLEQDYPELANDKKILIFVEAHGIAIDKAHYIQTSKNYIIPSKDLFTLLAENIPRPMDIIFTPCNGKAAYIDIDVLPIDSRVVIFSDSDKNTIHPSIEITLELLTNTTFTLDNFYNNYLAHIFLMNESPTMYTVGEESIDPIALSSYYLGKTISETSRKYIHNHFGKSVCDNDTSCHNKISYLIDKIEQSSSIEEFKISASKNYYSAMNEYVTQMSEYKFSRNNNHEKDIIYNYQDPEYCYAEILTLKNKADQIFLEHQIPLELDLLNEAWYGIDDDYPTDNDLEIMRESSDEAILYTLKSDGFVENSNFSQPETIEYGYVLGIIVNTHLSLSLKRGSEQVLPLNGESPLYPFLDLDLCS